MPKAIHITLDNVGIIMDAADSVGFNLEHLPDNLDDAASYNEELYLIMDGTQAEGNLTFTEFYGTDFNRLWRFTEKPKHHTFFAPIERI